MKEASSLFGEIYFYPLKYPSIQSFIPLCAPDWGYWGCWSPAQESRRSFLELNLAALYLSFITNLVNKLEKSDYMENVKNCTFMDLRMVRVIIDRQKSSGIIFSIWR